ncbi:MFS transporter [Meiothermus sp. QL-1]|uniref:MFS transporter n=1 Tax=Meiothermus sp. QL-1 TaxID=2058095 RepID=UPI000E0ADE69|nr:MFS transporter [Meiothermus sp. QL-1]RDI94660.1 MFS transporter [Meiothermus sp. QL-1]
MHRLPREVYILGSVSFLSDVASEMVYPLLPLFLTGVLGASAVAVGLIEGIAEATASLFKVVGGRLSDRAAARRPFLLLGYGLPALLRPVLALAQTPAHVLGFRFLDRMGKGLRTAPRDALIAEAAPKEAYGRAYGLHRAMDTLGATLGPFLAFALLPLLDFRGVFWASAIPAALATLLIVFFLREKPRPRLPLPPLRFSSLSPAYRRFLLVAAIATLGLASNAFLLLRLSDLGLNVAQTTLAYTAYNLLYALLAFPLGSLADRLGLRRMVMGGFAFHALAYLGFGLSSQPWHGVAWLLCYALYSAAFEGSSRAYLASITPPQEKASAIGLYHTVTGLLLLPAGLLFGLLWELLGPSWAFFTGSSLALLALGLFWLDPTQRRSYT